MFKTIVNVFGLKGSLTRDFASEHNAKSLAGKAIHQDAVRSVCVAEKETGNVVMYFNKTGDPANWVRPAD